MPLRIRPRSIGTFNQWLQRTNKWCRLTTSTCWRCGNVLVDLAFFAVVVEWLIDRNRLLLGIGKRGWNEEEYLVRHKCSVWQLLSRRIDDIAGSEYDLCRCDYHHGD